MTASDIELKALAEEEKRVVELSRAATNLKRAYEKAEEELTVASTALEWRRLLRRIEDDAVLKASAAALRTSIEAYDNSFGEPAGYENDEGVEYTATDDYGDFTPVEACVDGILTNAHQQLEQGHSDRAALLLLIVTAEIGRLLEAALTDAKGNSNVPLAEIEECRDGIVSEWQRLFYSESEGSEIGSGLLPARDAKHWYTVVSTHLGSPYDGAPGS